MTGLLITLAIVGELTVIPDSEDKGAAVVISSEPGGWAILGDGFKPISPAGIYENGTVCVIQAAPGTYGVLFIRIVDGVPQIDVSSVTIRGPPDPGPGPDPPPPPPPTPGERWLVVIEETGERTPQLFQLLNQLRNDPAIKDNHHLQIVDKDGKGPDGRPSEALAGYLRLKPSDAKFPYLFIVQRDDADQSRGRVLWQGELPKTYSEVMAKIKKYGG